MIVYLRKSNKEAILGRNHLYKNQQRVSHREGNKEDRRRSNKERVRPTQKVSKNKKVNRNQHLNRLDLQDHENQPKKTK